MKTLELVLIIMLVCFWGSENLYSQTMSWDESYTTTVLFDDFSQNQLDLNQWSVEDNSYSFNGVIIDSSATVSVNSGNLKLSVISCRDCSRAGETRDLAGGEIYSNESIQYGIFECSAKINISEASLPIFSFIGGNGNECANGNYYASEVDIFQVVEPYIIPVELQQRIYHHHPDTDCKLKSTSVNINSEQIETSLNDFFDYYHTYKCVWTPNYIRYYVDGDLKHEVTNTGAECPTCNRNWFPTYSSNVHLCNKVGGNIYYTNYSSTYFDWVRVKEFFSPPEITCPNLICTNGTAIMDVDNDASNITWSLTPTNLFSGTKTGTGKTATITAATGVGGQGKITYSFSMPSGETFTAEKTFWVGVPVISNISGPLYTPNNQWATYYAEPNDYRMAATDYNWILNPLNGNSVYDYGWSCDIAFYNSGSYQLIVQAKNQCSSPGYGPYYVTGVEVYDYQRLSISPNPTTGETTLAIESTSVDKTLDETVEWELEIYDSFQSLKEKKTKLKGKSTKIQTTGWKEGVYMVRVKYKEEILLGKLVVKK